MRRWIVLFLITGFLAACGSTANVQQERETLMRLDREWTAAFKDLDKFISYYASDAAIYPPGAPMATGAGIREALAKMSSTPGFSLESAATKADVSSSGDLGYTTGAFQTSVGGRTEKGKYVTVWKKQADGQWKVSQDIFNLDSSGAEPTSHVMVQSASITWTDPPPSLPHGSKMAVISGDPSKPDPFVVRAQVPAGYKIAPHWHPGDENVTVLSGTVALGMGETWDESKMQTLGSGGYAALPAEMRHFFLAKAASMIQVHGMGPLVVNYVNPSDDPSRK